MKMENKIPAETGIIFAPEHLDTIVRALEVYYRMRAAQIHIAFDILYPQASGESIELLEKTIKQGLLDHKTDKPIFEGLMGRGSGYGVGQPQLGDANLAYEIEKVIRQYKAVTNNDGYFKYSSVDYSDGLKVTDVPMPKVLGFNKYIDFEVEAIVSSQEQYESIYNMFLAQDYKSMWELIDRYIVLPKCEKKEVLEDCFDKGGCAPFSSESDYRLVVRCHKPIKKKEDNKIE